jgi:putative transferase (TIGR04331 family)
VRLVTTKHSRFCGTTGVVHLGSWCVEDLDSDNGCLKFLPLRKTTVDEKLEASSEVNRIVESIFPDLVSNLNVYHGVKKSNRYWRIVIGRWLFGFADVVYQRDRLIQRALAEFPITESEGLAISDMQLVGDCTQDYLSQLVSQEWNSALFGKLLSSRGVSVDWQEVATKKDQPEIYENGATIDGYAKWKLYGFLSSRSRIAIADPYLIRSKQILLSMRTRSIPLRVRRAPLRTDSFDEYGRNQLKILKNDVEATEQIIRQLLPMHLPRSVIELYKSLSDTRTWAGYPESPQLIFTANAHHSSDHFTIWTAEKVESGAELVISQHGGLYGESQIRTRHEEHEISIADKYLTWGWDDRCHQNVMPIPSLIGLGIKVRHPTAVKKRLLVIVADATLRFSRNPWDSSFDRAAYLLTLRNLAKRLSEVATSEVVVRLHHSQSKFDIDNTSDFLDLPNVLIDNGNSSMKKLMNQARLAVVTTFGTTFGENLLREIPTIMCVSPITFPPRQEFVSLYMQLEDAKILFWDSDQACEFVQSIWPNLDTWWKTDQVQHAISAYKQNFFCTVRSPIKKIAQVLNS